MKYILKDKEPVKEPDIMKWGKQFEDIENRRVGWNTIKKSDVSTVFLGIDHGHDITLKPILFETMVFGGKYDGEEERYTTWEEAEKGHHEWCKKVRED
jgi:hypothetical protein